MKKAEEMATPTKEPSISEEVKEKVGKVAESAQQNASELTTTEESTLTSLRKKAAEVISPPEPPTASKATEVTRKTARKVAEGADTLAQKAKEKLK